jgi:hypothetical protein
LVWFLHSDSLLFSAKENCSEPIRLGALRVATFYDLPGIPIPGPETALSKTAPV